MSKKMRKTLNELSRDPVAQSSCLRLEGLPSMTRDLNKDKGKVFDFRDAERITETRVPSKGNSNTKHGMEGMTNLVENPNGASKPLVITEERHTLIPTNTNHSILNGVTPLPRTEVREEMGNFVPNPTVPIFNVGVVEAACANL